MNTVEMNTVIASDQAIAIDQAEFTPASLTALEECSEESIYAPGHIQPHGVLLVLNESDLTVVQVSENVELIFGIPPSELLGRSLHHLFSQPQVNQIADFVRQNALDQCNPFELKARVHPGSTDFPGAAPSPLTVGKPSREKQSRPQAGNQTTLQTFSSSLYRVNELLILELEPQPKGKRLHSVQFYHRLQKAILNLRHTTSLSDLISTLAKEMKAMTGFDRVMIYHFQDDDHGVVIAEEKESHLESYLGLHYPATDIPTPSRRLFYRNWIRMIPHVQYTPVRLIALESLPTSKSLNLEDCVLRGVHPAHVEYLHNMGVNSSFTVSLIDDKRLWGLIACHHYSPRLVAYETRKTCEFLGQFASIELVHQQERELDGYYTQVRTIQDKLQQAFLQEPNFIQQVLIGHQAQVLDLVHAEGAAIALDQHISLIGTTPCLEEVQALLGWLVQCKSHNIYLTNCLPRLYPPAQAFKDRASGIIAISIVLHQKAYYMLWFRPEQIQTVHWAGNPQTARQVDADGTERLTPRKSFARWQEIVQETSLPWQPSEIEAARTMRNTLLLAVLEFSQVALEQAAERAAIANRAKSQFLAKMSHELRTPLNAILGFTQIMHRSPHTSPEFHEHLSIISRSGEHLLALINDVLEMSRIEAGQVTLNERYFNLYQMLHSLRAMFALKASQRGLKLNFEIDQSVPRYVCGDESKLRQVLINLISNAIKFTAEGSITVRARTTAVELHHQTCNCHPHSRSPCAPLMLCFDVQDTGCGIDSQYWEAVFEAFMQTEQGRYAEGTGLGLAISRQFARLMGGDIFVKSEVNRGSTFTCQTILYLPPLMTVEEPKPAHLIVGLEPGQPTYRILIVEDVPENRLLLETLLKSLGFEVATAENGEDAIAQWQVWQPHLIFMDIQLPAMSGYDVTRHIRRVEQHHSPHNAEEPNPNRCTIIALTAYAFEEDRLSSLQIGCDDYIAKPFDEMALLERIARHLKVRYIYADISSEFNILERKSLTRADLSIMSVEWIAHLHEAALDLNDERIFQLIAEIPSQYPDLAAELTLLVENFQLEAIATLTQA